MKVLNEEASSKFSRLLASALSKINSAQLAIYSAVVLFLAVAPKKWVPQCPIHKYFGIYCPGCGSVRAIRATLSGHIGIAFHDNLLLCLFPFLAVTGVIVAKREKRFALYFFYAAIFGLTLTFTIWRNLPHSPLAPLG